MDPDRLQEISERDQLWASLRGLRSEIEGLATGEWGATEREQQMVVILARIVLAEMNYRAKDAEAS